jgi:GTP pyrophosphokinase
VTSPDLARPGRHVGTPQLTDQPVLGLEVLERLGPTRPELVRFLLEYKFGIEEVQTKIGILQQEFQALHEYCPIEHVSSRLKSPNSIRDKIERKNVQATLPAIRSTITDIAGLRITCSFASDVYRMAESLGRQPDLTVLHVKDYIARPKPNGYRSLHMLVTVPVYLSSSVVEIPVEIQLRTVAMDFWASLEHKIHYKYRNDVPDDVRTQLREAAATAHELDTLMEGLHVRVHGT